MSDDRRIAQAQAQARQAHEQQVADILSQISGRSATKQRATILALVEAELHPEINRKDIWKRKDTCSSKTYYDSWRQDATFADTYERVLRLARDFEAGRRMREMNARREAWQVRSREVAGKMLDKAIAMLDFPLARRITDEGGRHVTIEPANWTLGHAATLAQTADKLARLALEMQTSHRRQTNIDIPYESLPTEALERIVEGEDPLTVLLDLAQSATEADSP